MTVDRAVFLGFTVPDAFARHLFQSDPLPAVQTHKFAWSFTKTLTHVYRHVFLLSAAPVQGFPITPFKSFTEVAFQEHGVPGVILAANNHRLLRHLSRFLACLKFTHRLRRVWAPDVIFIHGVHSPFLAYAWVLKLFQIKSIVILTDAPGVILPTDGHLRRFLKKIDWSIVKILLRSVNGIVALAPALAESLAGGKPTIIVPGIISLSWQDEVAYLKQETVNPRFTVTYAGGIEESYGVKLLVEAAALLPDIDFRICGRGSYLETLRKVAPKNVTLPGFLNQDEVAQELMRSDLLINPRPSALDFSSMSFPSKLLEYLATGRPVMSTRITSIPPELKESFYYITEETGTGLADAIQSVTRIDKQTRESFGAAAQKQAVSCLGEVAVANKLQAFWAGRRAPTVR